jgi:Skp family chaperone for outer membrane proteins
MKLNRIVSLLALVLGISAAPVTAQAQLKVGTIDMKQVFDSYYKTKDAEAKINESRAQAQKELAERLDTFNKAQEQARKLNDEAGKAELSEKAKAEKVKSLNEKLQELGVMQREVQEFQQTRERQLSEQSVRSRNSLVEEINKVVSDAVKAGGFDLVFDKSGQSLNAVNLLVHSKESFDFTADVVSKLNADQKKK